MATPPGSEAERDGRYFLEGNTLIDNTGRVWVCTTAGAPGSWTIVAQTSADITDGTIVNADINASAAIAESKLNLASDAAAGTASRRSLGTTSTTAAAGSDTRFASLTGTTSDVLVSTKALATTLTTAPADASLAAGEAAIWFDSTNGASKLMVKAKQADGTVKTAAVALS